MGTTSNNTTSTSFNTLTTSFSSSKLIPSINKFISSSSPSPSLHSLNNTTSLSITTHLPIQNTITPSSLMNLASSLITFNINTIQSHSVYHSLLSLRHEKPKQQITTFNNINKLFNINQKFKVKPKRSQSNLNKTYKTCSSEYSNNKSIYSSIVDIDTSSINKKFKRTTSNIVRTKTNTHKYQHNNDECINDNNNNNNSCMKLLHKKNTFNHLSHRTKRCFNLNNDVHRLLNVTIKEEKENDRSNNYISEFKIRKGKTVIASLKDYNDIQRMKLNQNEFKRSLLCNSKKYAEQLRHSVLIKKTNELGGHNECISRKHKVKTIHEKSLMYFLNENLAQSILDNNHKHNKRNSNSSYKQIKNNIYKVDIKQLANMKGDKYDTSSCKKGKQNNKRKSHNKLIKRNLHLSNDSKEIKHSNNKRNESSSKCKRFISTLDYLLNVDQSYKNKLQQQKLAKTKTNTNIKSYNYVFNKHKANTFTKPLHQPKNLLKLFNKPKDTSEHESIDNNYKTMYTKENLITKEATITEDDDDYYSFLEYLNE